MRRTYLQHHADTACYAVTVDTVTCRTYGPVSDTVESHATNRIHRAIRWEVARLTLDQLAWADAMGEMSAMGDALRRMFQKYA